MRFLAALAVSLTLAAPAHAFCGFFVGKADGQLFNKSSQVAIVRDGEHTVLTLSNDYKGALTDFALVVPVPAVLQREQIHIGDRKLLERLDAYSAPRLVDYQDEDPCENRRYAPRAMEAAAGASMDMTPAPRKEAKAKGVTVEAEYTVGEYDIVLLSATESGGLASWLTGNGYKIPQRAADALAPYIRQGMKFFVARVNLKEQKATGFQGLRPLQIAFASPRFMLPIRLGMANSDGTQDLIVYTLTRNGRVESSNYQTAKIPSDLELPEYVQNQFGPFYQAAFEKSWKGLHQRGILTEYVWNMGSCDPCSAPPLENDELKGLGVYWLDDQSGAYHGGGMPVTLTRLHVRYDGEHFPDDLAFQETGDQQPFQGRYVLRHPFRGDLSCPAGREYQKQLQVRRREEAKTLAALTGWEVSRIHTAMGKDAPDSAPPAWWKKLWR